MSRHPYDNAYRIDNVYGNAISLLKSYSMEEGDGVHLDLASGFSVIGEVIESELHRHYIGLDLSSLGLASAKERGLEVHEQDLTSVGVLDEIEGILAGRRIRSISFLDGLEHIGSSSGVLRTVAELCRRYDAQLVISVPNITHQDVAHKLLLGQWDYTVAGLLDQTHIEFFSEKSLTQRLSEAGLHCVERKNVEKARSDQHFPLTNPALQEGTTLNQFLGHLRDSAEPNGRVNQFVWSCVAGPAAVSALVESTHLVDARPFLSILTRTQGRRMAELQEVFNCLAGQTCADFEVLVLGHKVPYSDQLQIERAIEDNPEWLRNRISYYSVDHGGRTTPLNAGVKWAQGRYVIVLDDDDIIFANWVESFLASEKRSPGALLRGVAARQTVDRVKVRGLTGVRAEGSPDCVYPAEFSFTSHLVANGTPPVSVAFPRGLFDDLGMSFDETMTTTEDWDLIIRSAAVVGVEDSKKITSIYHWWESQESSRTEHVSREWVLNQLAIDRKVDSVPLLLPAGESRAVRELVMSAAIPARDDSALRKELEDLRDTDREMFARYRAESNYRAGMLHRISTILESRSWRINKFGRGLSRILGGGHSVKLSDCVSFTTDELVATIQRLEASRSWRSTSWIRRARGRG